VLETTGREELRAMKDAIASAFLKVPTFKSLDLVFGAAIQEKPSPADKLILLASQALAEAVAMGSPELIIRPNQYSRRSRSTGNLRRGTGRMARARPTVDAVYILKAAASKGDESLRFILEALLSSLSMTRDAFLDTLISRLCHWLDADRGAYFRGPKGGNLKFDWTLSDSGQRSSDKLEIDERVLRVVQISGRCECFTIDNDDWILALPLRDSSQDLCLVFKFPPEQERFFIPPALLTSLLLAIESAFELFRLRDRHDKDRSEIKALRERIETLQKSQTGELVPVKPKRPELVKGRYQRIIGRSAAMGRVLRILDRVTDSDVPVLIQGETGTGKELVARCLHENGPRFDSGFLTINCSALSETLMESELFGHSKGAFTGATEDKEGYFERADGGTLFLDEVQDMSPLMQRELLRVLQEGEVQRVGGKRVIKVDVRIIAATNKDLKELVNEKRFRQDLYYRLNVVIVDLPPLRRRREDLPELVDHFLTSLAERYTLTRPRLEQDALQMLIDHDWAGNIRELQNLLEKTLLMLDGQVIRARDIRFEGSGEMRPRPVETYFDRPYKVAKESFLKEYLKSCLARHGGHVTKAAKEAGIVRSSFHKMMAKHNISTQDFLPMRRER
ncbi:MAG: sigma-54 dependent transcriptional regulator, partial [Planctomycetota bacterium]|nr:sigma-54 dependent transcriptional regulator [Planctomycetota bacterium]